MFSINVRDRKYVVVETQAMELNRGWVSTTLVRGVNLGSTVVSCSLVK